MFNPFQKRTPQARMPAAERPAPAPAAAEPKAAPAKGGRPSDRDQDRRLIGVITRPHLTEKATAAAGGGWYTFRVRTDASKPVIRRAVEERYGVTVERVRVAHQRGKAVRLGRTSGESPGFKKAMVKVKEGQSIEFS